jgi:hypothetical protein
MWVLVSHTEGRTCNLRVFQNRLLREWRKYVTRSFRICTPHQLFGWSIKKNEMGRANGSDGKRSLGRFRHVWGRARQKYLLVRRTITIHSLSTWRASLSEAKCLSDLPLSCITVHAHLRVVFDAQAAMLPTCVCIDCSFMGCLLTDSDFGGSKFLCILGVSLLDYTTSISEDEIYV